MLPSLDLFSGCGGITHALRDVAEPVMYCEIDPVPRSMLSTLMQSGALKEAPVHNDVSTLDGHALRGKVRMIVGGFPCTAVSTAGNQQGLDHPATGLFWQIVRLAREIEPDFLFMENVAAISESRQNGRSVLDDVVQAVQAIGYAIQWITVPAYQVGAPLQRYRWFCLCYKPGAHTLDFRKWQRFDWSREPQGPRMVEPSITVRQRIATLGNSVVPDCVNLAFRALWTGLAVPLDDLWDLEGPVDLKPASPAPAKTRVSARYGVGVDGVVVPALPPPGVVPKPNLRIPLDPEAFVRPDGYRGSPRVGTPLLEPMYLSTWPAPRYSNGWRGAKTLTYRGRGDLGTAVRFAADNRAKYTDRVGYTNPEFAEWLMGYPTGWTLRDSDPSA